MDGQNLTRANAWLALNASPSVPSGFRMDVAPPPGPLVQLRATNTAVFVPKPGTQLWDGDSGRMTVAP